MKNIFFCNKILCLIIFNKICDNDPLRYVKNKDFSWLQLVNVFGLYWGIFFCSAYGELVLAGIFSQVFILAAIKSLSHYLRITVGPV